MGDDMIIELANILDPVVKTAAKEEVEVKQADNSEEQKKEATMNIVNGLAKLASELDELGDTDASSVVDEALNIIIKNIQENK